MFLGREEECIRWLNDASKYTQTVDLNALVSVVIVGHNEKPQIIKETIVSLLQNTTNQYLKEILFVDDASDVPVDLGSHNFDVG